MIEARPNAAPAAATQQQPVVSVDHVAVAYPSREGTFHALSDVSLNVARGEFISLIGPSGCGKTTLLRLIADLAQPTSGQLRVNGGTPQQARTDRSYGYVFQSPALYPWRTAINNVMLPLEIIGLGAAERRERATAALAAVGLAEAARRYPWQLSGGMQQRVSIARALSLQPELLLMDEPFGALDEITRDKLNLHLTDLWRERNLTVIFVTHSIPEAVFLSTRVVAMSANPGRISRVIECPFPRRRTLDLRDTRQFLDISQQVRDALSDAYADE
ncbi:MAG TPA: ABC transporter ATP-binding protein [Rhodopila sp.]|nr:ABC transporter ATP-binding protein [Rhodopila sp.]